MLDTIDCFWFSIYGDYFQAMKCVLDQNDKKRNNFKTIN